MKIALLLNKQKLLSNFNDVETMLVYECYGQLKSLIFKNKIYGFREFYEIAYEQNIDCVLLDSLDENEKTKLEDLKINYFVMNAVDVDTALDDFFHFDRREIHPISDLAKYQQTAQYMEFDKDFTIGYFDDDDIGGS